MTAKIALARYRVACQALKLSRWCTPYEESSFPVSDPRCLPTHFAKCALSPIQLYPAFASLTRSTPLSSSISLAESARRSIQCFPAGIMTMEENLLFHSLPGFMRETARVKSSIQNEEGPLLPPSGVGYELFIFVVR